MISAEWIKNTRLIDYTSKTDGIISIVMCLYLIFHTIPQFIVLTEFQKMKKKTCNKSNEINEETEECDSRSDTQKAHLAINIITLLIGIILLVICSLSLYKIIKYPKEIKKPLLTETSKIYRFWGEGIIIFVIGLYFMGISIPQLLIMTEHDNYDKNICEKKKENEIEEKKKRVGGCDKACKDEIEYKYHYDCQLHNLRNDTSKANLSIAIIKLLMGFALIVASTIGRKYFKIGAIEQREFDTAPYREMAEEERIRDEKDKKDIMAAIRGLQEN